MPSEKLGKDTLLKLKKFSTMEVQIPENDSMADLVRRTDSETPRSFRSISFREWTAVGILCFVNLINYMDRFTIAGILEQVQDDFNISDDRGGLLQTGFVVSYMIFGPVFGYLGDRYSRRKIMAFGVFFWSMTTFVGSFMSNYWWFLLFRGLVGVGEASYSTIAPTIISDLFVGDMRSKMLALFYFAIPVGSGVGYIVGSETAALMKEWRYALRVTPILGVIAVLLIYFVLKEPERGESECTGHLEPTSWQQDLKELMRNRSFIYSTAGFTCVAFVAGALSWWGPKFIKMGLHLQSGDSVVDTDNISLIFGIVAVAGGIIGLLSGSLLSQWLNKKYPKADPYICAGGLFISTPLMLGTALTANSNIYVCFTLCFLAQVFLNFNWSIVADMLLYVVMPTRRSTAEGFQLLVSHALGDAGSPSLIGVMSDLFKVRLEKQKYGAAKMYSPVANTTTIVDFKALQYSLFTACFVEVLGGLFFLITAFYIVHDRTKVDKAVQDGPQNRAPSQEEVPPASTN